MLKEHARVLTVSTCWETEAVMIQPSQVKWPNFYNLGACVATSFNAEALKRTVLQPIEQALGRVRSADKYAPRPIDLDIVIFDNQVIDPEIWERLYLALIFAEMLPSLRNPETGETPQEAATRLSPGKIAIPHPEIAFS